ncbi:MAG: hypothetical protein K2Y05_07385, partial [Hyphomicrobiaceae bacterium]|nr:hypothetical protein [Hyphomicrobiaceae bacterium]
MAKELPSLDLFAAGGAVPAAVGGPVPPALPGSEAPAVGEIAAAPPIPPPLPDASANDDLSADPPRRTARRRPAGPARTRVAANDDAPTIGGLIFALEQKPSNRPFHFAAIFSAAWAVVGLGIAGIHLSNELGRGIP